MAAGTDAGTDRQARALTLLAVLVATGLIAAGSAVSLPFSDHRLTYFTYPRYLHFLYPVWLLVGFAAARAATRRRRIQAAVATAALMAFSAGLARLVHIVASV